MTNRSGGWGELLSGRNGLRSLALAGGVALHAINVYMVTTVLPSAVRDIGGLAYYAWNMTLFVAASIFGSAVTPRLLSSMGPRQALSWAIVIFRAALPARWRPPCHGCSWGAVCRAWAAGCCWA